MKKRSIVLIFIIIFIGGSYLQTRLEIRASYSKNFEIVQKKKEQNIRLFSALAESLFPLHRTDMIEGHFRDAIKNRLFDFFILSYKLNPVATGTIRPLSEQALKTLMKPQPYDMFLQFDSKLEPTSSVYRDDKNKKEGSIENFRFIVTKLAPEWEIRIGVNLDREAFFFELDDLVKEENLRIFWATAILTILIFLFVSKDIRRAVSVLQRRGGDRLRAVRTYSTEADLMLRSVLGFEGMVGRLKEEQKRLSAQVLPSLKTELHLGKKPPYDFDCTLVRTDINNFSEIFRKFPTDVFLAQINEFFNDCSHIISRYEGLIHEFVGDEIIFYIKDRPQINSFTLALRCLDEINQAAEKMHQRTTRESGYDFRVKSSAAHGTLRFGPLLNGFSIAGSSLIETVRILSAVHEKTENSVYFDSRHLGLLHDGIFHSVAAQVQLKGMDGERTLLKYQGHRPLHQIITSADERIVSDYRSIGDFIFILQTVRTFKASEESRLANLLMTAISQLRLTGHEPKVAIEAAQTVSYVLENSMDAKISSALTASLGRLGLEADETRREDFFKLIARCLRAKEPRVVANTLDALFELKRKEVELPEFLIVECRKLGRRPEARIRANLFALEATIGFAQPLLEGLKKMVEKGTDAEAKSAYFAIQRIESYFLDLDPVYLKTQVEFENIGKAVRRRLHVGSNAA